MKNILNKYSTIIHIFVIAIVVLFEIMFAIKGPYVFGCGGDWYIQSVSFYEYFRNLFYETGKIFPDLALHIGGGQNIYYFVYYGLYSPYLFLLYLLPNVSAGNFIMFTCCLNIMVSSIMLYFFLIKSNYSKSVSLFGALLLATCTGFVFSSIQFIMFVQYMPFLILGLFGTKKFLDTRKSTLLVISVVLLITTNYYFSFAALFGLCIYALYYYMKINDKLKYKFMLRCGIQYFCRLLLGIVISGFLILPILYIIINGRSTSLIDFSINDFIPKIYFNYLMHDSFGLGLSSMVWIALLYNILHKRKENKCIGIILFLVVSISFINLILNGFLYNSGKIMICFVPLYIILIIEMIIDLKRCSNKKMFLIFVLSIILGKLMIDFYNEENMIIFFRDLIFSCFVLFLFKKFKKNIFIYAVILVSFSVTTSYFEKRNIRLLDYEYKDMYEIVNIGDGDYINNNTLNLYRMVYDRTLFGLNLSNASTMLLPTIYSSTYNKTYRDIYYETFNNNHENYNLLLMPSTENSFFYKFMGVRYIFGDYNIPYGYKLVKEYKNINLYENDKVNSLGFVSSRLLNYDEYNKLSFMEKLLAYQNNIIIKGKSYNSNLIFDYQKIDFDVDIMDASGIKLEFKDNHYIVSSYYGGKITLGLKKKLKNKTLIIRFNVGDSETDHLSIKINGIENTLSYNNFMYYNNNKTFDYVINGNEVIDTLYLDFSKGIYDISDIEIYAVDNSFFDKNNTIPLNIDFDRTKGDDIYGSVDVKESGYFIFTIPYDKGFTAYVDGKEVDIEQVNDGFIGFKINEGKHDIHLKFEAPYAKLGRVISLIGIIILIALNVRERKKIKYSR